MPNGWQAGFRCNTSSGRPNSTDVALRCAGGVLIPRPETEELGDRIVRSERDAQSAPSQQAGEAPGTIRILDVGTGSGCIAASLALELPEAEVFAAEIADEALAVAEENFRRLGARVTLRRADALNGLEAQFPEKFDLIVSNPPYVPASDRAAMHPNVRDHEPAVALFVPDDDPPVLLPRHRTRRAADAAARRAALVRDLRTRGGGDAQNARQGGLHRYDRLQGPFR